MVEVVIGFNRPGSNMKGLYFDNLGVREDLWTLDIAWIRHSEGQTHQAVGLL